MMKYISKINNWLRLYVGVKCACFLSGAFFIMTLVYLGTEHYISAAVHALLSYYNLWVAREIEREENRNDGT